VLANEDFLFFSSFELVLLQSCGLQVVLFLTSWDGYDAIFRLLGLFENERPCLCFVFFHKFLRRQFCHDESDLAI
jgi:hypothetical protein